MQNAGSLQRLAASPVGSRILQSCVKHGSTEQRKQILRELTPQLLELSKSPYAYHVVCKLVDTASKADVEGETHRPACKGRRHFGIVMGEDCMALSRV